MEEVINVTFGLIIMMARKREMTCHRFATSSSYVESVLKGITIYSGIL